MKRNAQSLPRLLSELESIYNFMPYKSLAQERYFNSNRAKLEKQGVNVDEWNKASAGKKLPMRINKKVKVAKKLLKKYKNL